MRAVALVNCCLLALGSCRAEAAARPNVLFIAADDLRCDLGCYGNPDAKTPNLDRLAASGRLFERAYCQQALCNPSRSSLMTGLRPHRVGVRSNKVHFREQLPGAITLPQWFRTHGYHTVALGKLYHNYDTAIQGDPASWSEPQQFHWGPHFSDWVTPGKPFGTPVPRGPATQCLEVPDNAYLDGRIAAAAVETLARLKDRPFFLGVGFWKPHLPYNAPKKYWDLFDRAALAGPRPAGRAPEAPAIAFHYGGEVRSYTDMPKSGPIPAAAGARLRHGYLAGISFLDANVGKLLAALDRLGLRDNTVVVFWGDNGYHLGEHRQWGKETEFEFAARVPLILSVPGQTRPGKATASLAELVDLYPTLADLCGLPVPDSLDGTSLRPVLDNPAAVVKQGAFTQCPRPAGGGPIEAMGRSIRTDRFRYTEWRAAADDSTVLARELYDHQADPLESDNLADDPAQAATVAALAERLAETYSLPASSYRRFEVEERDGRIAATKPLPEPGLPRWAREVDRQAAAWHPLPPDRPLFLAPIPFVVPPADPGETFLPHNHQPSVTWLANGDLLAIWYTTREEAGTELTVLASRLRRGAGAWDPSAVFFKAEGHNMHGSAIFHDGQGTIHHLNGIAPAGARGWAKLAMLHRVSRDHGVTWSAPRPACPVYRQRHQVISGTFLAADGALVQPCDAVPGGAGGTALQISHDLGHSWSDPGENQPAPRFEAGATGRGTIAGIHAGVVPLRDGRLLAFGRGDPIDGQMPRSVSADNGQTWAYAASSFPPIGGGQRLVLLRLREGPLLFVSFTARGRQERNDPGLDFPSAGGGSFRGHGLFAALSFDEGQTWPTRKLLTPGTGEYDGGAWTGKFTATPDRAEPAGYLAATQSPDGVVHLLSSRLHYRFNLAWLQQVPPAASVQKGQ